jgi:hypothetical protein
MQSGSYRNVSRTCRQSETGIALRTYPYPYESAQRGAAWADRLEAVYGNGLETDERSPAQPAAWPSP